MKGDDARKATHAVYSQAGGYARVRAASEALAVAMGQPADQWRVWKREAGIMIRAVDAVDREEMRAQRAAARAAAEQAARDERREARRAAALAEAVERAKAEPKPAPPAKPTYPRRKPMFRPERCGTNAGYQQHTRHPEHPTCGPCLDAHNEYKREQRHNRPVRVSFDPSKCGTYAGYEQHRRHQSDPCGPCRDARNAYLREHRPSRAVVIKEGTEK